MSFPAWDSFDGDDRAKSRHVKVYRWCRKNLDFRQVRYGKRETIHADTGVHVADVTRVLWSLVEWGYLCEHPHGPGEARRFTLCWSRGGETPPCEQPSDGGVAA